MLDDGLRIRNDELRIKNIELRIRNEWAVISRQ